MKNSDDTTLPIYANKASSLTKVLFIISALGLLFQFIKTCSFLFIAEKLSFTLKKDVYRKLLFLPYPYHEKTEDK
jgi:ABC-type multidrug transport system fused ATPase/permease subunit